MIKPETKLITILGPTASGKTDLAIALAKKFDGEVVCADSRTIYRGMDIGTAKPTLAEQQGIKHHLLDIAEPSEVVGAAEFKRLAEAAITDIASRGKVPFLVGGSGLYLDAVLYNYDFPSPPDARLRQTLQNMNIEQLKAQLAKVDPRALTEIDQHNPRRLIRAIETAGQSRAKQHQIRPNTLVIGLGLNKEIIHKRIAQRAEKMLQQGIIDEVQQMAERFGWDAPGMNGSAYRAFKLTILNAATPAEGLASMIASDKLLAKKQWTWFARNKSIQWLDNPSDAIVLVREFLGDQAR